MNKLRKHKHALISVASVSVFILVWYLMTTVTGLINTRVLPGPDQILKALVGKFTNKNPDGQLLHVHILSSLKVALTGYGIGLGIGVPLGICMAWYKKFDYFARPLFDLIRPVPGIAWIPLMIILFGIGLMSKAMVVFLSSFTACVINSYSGIKQTKSVHLWVGETFGYSNTRQLLFIAIPTSLPLVLTGMRVALGASWGALVAAELLASTAGLGFMLQQARSLMRADLVIAGMVAIGGIGALLALLITLIEKILLKGGRW